MAKPSGTSNAITAARSGESMATESHRKTAAVNTFMRAAISSFQRVRAL